MKKIVGLALMILSVITLSCCGAYGFFCYQDYHGTVGKMKNLEGSYVVRAEAEADTKTKNETQKSGQKNPATSSAKEKADPLQIDWQGLQEEVSNVIAWIDIPGLDLSYPIVQGDDNDYYLHHNVDGKESGYGSIFLNSGNSPDFSDSHNIVFGHNMRDGSMFRKVNYYEDRSTFRSAPNIYIYTSGGRTLMYRVFSVYQSPVGDVSFKYGNELGSKDYKDQIEAIKKLSEYDTGTEVSDKMPFITLMTCNTRLDYSSRTSVSAILISDTVSTTNPFS